MALTHAVAFVIALVVGSNVQTADQWKLRKIATELEEFVDDANHMVDMGVVLRVVDRAKSKSKSDLTINGQRLDIVREHRFGGMVDTRLAVPAFVGPSKNPVVWHCSRAQEPLIIHDDSEPLRSLAMGAMGGGKTETLSKWLGLRVLELMGSNGPNIVQLGATAPTNARTQMIQKACRADFPRAWYRWSERHSTFIFRCKVEIKCVSTHQQSRAEGSPVQGFNWPAAGSDELQDSISADPDIEARGRAAPKGRYKRFASVTSKPSDTWRTWFAAAKASSMWSIKHMRGMDNPFVDPQYWEDLKSTMSERDYARRVLAQDIGPERMVYGQFEREHNVVPIPTVGSIDVTAEVLGHLGRGREILLGHDPGTLNDVSVMLKAYRRKSSTKHDWIIVNELTTEQSTTEDHIQQLLEILRSQYGLHRVDYKGRPIEGSPVVLGRGDPYGDRENGTHRSVYTQFRNAGIDLRPATYKPGTVKPGRVPKEAGIDMICRLLLDAEGRRRLFVACDESARPLAPMVVRSFEMSERDGDGRAEAGAKDKSDLSHWASAVRYALWELERPRFGAMQAAVSQ